ncbi:MAG TPA: ATP-binding protein [Gemmatimonadales bacterium]|nr:ATP-binding protein [Gemmatimonadales bacterium]
MPALRRPPPVLMTVAAVSFGAAVVAYLVVPPHRPARAVVADLSWSWMAAVALVAAAVAARHSIDTTARHGWTWIAAGCASFLAGGLVRSVDAVVRHGSAPYPSLADLGVLGLYGCTLVALTKLVRTTPAGGAERLDVELALDTALVTMTAGALAYVFVLKGLFEAGATLPALLASLGWSLGGVAVLWVILVKLLRATRVPLVPTGVALGGILALCAANVAYAVVALGGGFRPGAGVALGWDVGFLLLASAAALAPAEAPAGPPATRPLAARGARVAAVIVGFAGIGAVAVAQALRPERDEGAAILLGAAVGIIALRFAQGLRATHRYAELLEGEVASQTRSLVQSLRATAAAEWNLRLVMDAVPDAIVVVDRAGRILETNEPAHAMGRVAGTSPPGALFDLVHPEAAGPAADRLAAAFEGDVQHLDVSLARPDGSRGLAALLYAPVREGNAIPRVLVLARDVTDQRRAESQYQQAEKLAAMAQLVSGVAHEINNPAAIISGFAQTLLLDDVKPEQREMLQMMYDEATRIGRITANLLAFARAGGKQRTLVDLNDLARRTFALRAYHLSTLSISVTLELDPAEPKLWADASELQQLFLALLINAEQALVTVEPPRTLTVRTEADEHDLRLEVRDSGPGIAPEIRGKIFDPFFTTKPEGVGTGLGLSICYGIARDHGGKIWVESEPGRGAAFFVHLPRDPRREARAAEDPLDAVAGGAAPPLAPGVARAAPLTVLVVDDEVALRNALLRFLTRREMRAEGVGDGGEALRRLAQRQFDVIVCDVRMPGMSGREFLERLRREHPELAGRVVFSTGDAFTTETADFLRQAGVLTVAKPLDFAALERVIREVAARPPTPPVAPARPAAS